MDAMFVGQVAREATRQLARLVKPREITALFYDGVISDDLGPVVAGRRLIRPEAIEAIVNALRQRAAVQSSKGAGDAQ